MITLEGITYRYAGADAPALTDCSLELRDGTVVGVVGASEAGKSTLCLVTAGLAPKVIGGALRGRLLVDGADARQLPMHELATRTAIGFQRAATQLSGVADTVYEEVAFGPANLGVPGSELIERTEEALAGVGITDLAGRHPTRLSGGQQQLVAIAGLLAMRPRHLVLDEPTAELDPHGTALVTAVLERLAAAGVAILIAEQRTDLLMSLASRVLALERGSVVLDGAPDEVFGHDRLPALGVRPPASLRLRRLAAARGVSQEALRP